MDQIKDGWFSEKHDLWPGQCLSLKVEEVLHQSKSNYQDVLVLKTTNHGKALILDGIIQCTQFDEFAYQEMIAFIPLCAHGNPEKVLIVGGGDGGVAREVAKHPLVKNLVQVEIDEKVVQVSKKHLQFMSKGFDSPKLTLHIADGFEYMKNHRGEFDVIITDSSDPVGPAQNLFTENYFKLLKSALKEDGVICSQGGTPWIDMEHIKQTMEHCRKHFAVVKYAVASVPTYPCGQIGFVVAAVKQIDITKASFRFGKDVDLKYYNEEVHSASFVLPNFVRKVLKEKTDF